MLVCKREKFHTKHILQMSGHAWSYSTPLSLPVLASLKQPDHPTLHAAVIEP